VFNPLENLKPSYFMPDSSKNLSLPTNVNV